MLRDKESKRCFPSFTCCILLIRQLVNHWQMELDTYSWESLSCSSSGMLLKAEQSPQTISLHLSLGYWGVDKTAQKNNLGPGYIICKLQSICSVFSQPVRRSGPLTDSARKLSFCDAKSSGSGSCLFQNDNFFILLLFN